MMNGCRWALAAAALLVLVGPARAYDTTVDEDDLDDSPAVEREHDHDLRAYDRETDDDEREPAYDGHTEYGEPVPEYGHDEPAPRWQPEHRSDFDEDESDSEEHWRSDDDDDRDLEPSTPHEDTPGNRVEGGLDEAGDATRRSLRGVPPVGKGLDKAMKATGRGLNKAITKTGEGLHKAGDALTGGHDEATEPPPEVNGAQ